MPGRDIIVIGASAGGLDPLMEVVRKLPADLPAAVFVVMHLSPLHKSFLPEILQRSGRLPAASARHGEPIRKGRIYVAPPDRHMLIENSSVRLSIEPRVNHARPAIDPLFRSAASTYGRRVVGVILSGSLFDGTAGLLAIKKGGGATMVQNPEEAAFQSMPWNALLKVPVDQILSASALAPALLREVHDSRKKEDR